MRKRRGESLGKGSDDGSLGFRLVKIRGVANETEVVCKSFGVLLFCVFSWVFSPERESL